MALPVLDPGITPEGPALLPLEAGEQYRFAFAMEACVGCHSCEAACAEQNGLPPGTAWRRVGEIEGGEFPHTRRLHLSMSCNHCLEPACLIGCPTDAYVKLDSGVVAHRADECIGCQYCTWNCPYSVPVFQPDRRIVTKCDMCLPRLDAGLEPACVGACPTKAISVEKVDVAAWRKDHTTGDAPLLPSSDLTLSTTRYEVPAGVPLETFGGSDWALRPEHPHWPLVWLTLLTQAAVGASLTAADGAGRLTAAVLAAVALAVSLLHLGRPLHAWKALRNLRRSWLSREVALFGAYGGLAGLAVGVPEAAPLAALVGAAGVYASGRLYMVPGRPAWCSPLTLVCFGTTTLALGGLVTGHRPVAVTGVIGGLLTTAANLARLARGTRIEWWGTVRLALRRFRNLSVLAGVLSVAGIVAAVSGPLLVALAFVAGAELIGRYLFYVTVVPLDMPGSFYRSMA
ncbi:MAG: DmsC/YnfH family molybdoenzyme membrane anchor subunit [Actinomycetota bacterium]|jgi:formate dehydrogenase iron-sulfur subunit